MINKTFLLLFVSFCCQHLVAQNEADSLFSQILSDQSHHKEQNIDFSSTFFDENKPDPTPTTKRNAYERYLLLGTDLYNQGKYLDALKIFNNLSEHKIYRTAEERILIQYYLAICFQQLNKLPLAIYYSDKFILDLEEHPISSQKLHHFYSSYASMKLNNGDTEESLPYFNKCLKIAEELNDSLLLLRSYNNLGVAHSRAKNYKTALKYFNLIQSPEFKKYQTTLYAFSFGNAAAIQLKKENAENAISLFRKELELMNENHIVDGKLNTYFYMADAFEQLNQRDSALKYDQLALQFAEEHGRIHEIVKAYEKLIGILDYQKNSKEFGKLFNTYLTAKDSLNRFNQVRDKQVVEQLSRIVDISRNSLIKKNEINNLALQKQQLVYLIISLCIIVLGLFTFIFLRAKSRKVIQTAYADLAEKNKALQASFQTISQTNTQNELLLREVHHRVKNNLQMLSSMFNLQKNATKDEKLKDVFSQAQDRIMSIALVHQKIYQTNDFEAVNLRAYIESLIKEITQETAQSNHFVIELDQLTLPIGKTIPLGLILSELITNSLKHGQVDNEALKIHILGKLNGQTYTIRYTDNGPGLQMPHSPKNSSIGLMLVELFAQQLEAEIEFKDQTKGGFYCSIQIPIFD